MLFIWFWLFGSHDLMIQFYTIQYCILHSLVCLLISSLCAFVYQVTFVPLSSSMCPSLPLYLCVFFALQLLVVSYLSVSLFCYHASPPCVSFLFSPLCHVNPCLFLQRTQCQAVCLSLRLSVFPVLFCTLCSAGSVLLPSVQSTACVPHLFPFPSLPPISM